MSDYINNFKAGDFTSGKMGEIFKTCHMDKLAVITHKQFGTAYLVPEDEIRLMALDKLRAFDVSGNNMNHACGTVESVKEFVSSLTSQNAQTYNEIKDLKLDTWLDVLKAI